MRWLLEGMPVEALRLRGRWADQRSLEHYAQECAASLADINYTAAQRDTLAWVGGLLIDLLQEAGVALRLRRSTGAFVPTDLGEPVPHPVAQRHMRKARL